VKSLPNPHAFLAIDTTNKSTTPNLENNICDFILKLVSNTSENNMMMKHLLVDLMQVIGRQDIILTKLQCGLVHPIHVTKFQGFNNGHMMGLKCMGDFFNHRDAPKKIKSRRKLNMDNLG